MKKYTQSEIEEIIAERDFYKKILNKIPAVIHVNNLNTQLVEWVNDFTEQLSGFKKEQIINNPNFLPDNLIQDDHEIIDNSIFDYRHIDGVNSAIYSLRTANGEVATYHALGVVFENDENNQPIRSIGIDIDITHELRSYKQLKRQYEEQTRKLNQEIINKFTDNEINIIKLLCEGKVLKEIATILMRSPHTIDKHIRKIFRKLSINKTNQLTLWAKEIGLV